MVRPLGVLMVAAVLAFPAGAAAITFYSEHKAWCDANLPSDQYARGICANRNWCDTHWNDDRITRVSCDPFRSRVDFSLPTITVSVAGLDAGCDLTDVETRSFCFDVMYAPDGCGVARDGGPERILPDTELLPP
jgi:hypothetical protein